MTMSGLFQVSDIMPFIVFVFGNGWNVVVIGREAADDVNTVFG